MGSPPGEVSFRVFRGPFGSIGGGTSGSLKKKMRGFSLRMWTSLGILRDV